MSLASRYRPQTFAQVVGQKLATTALSRAAASDMAAPAYLLSGTRGVGKTTIARIFAKALNCEHAPGPEPCNVCGACKRITTGNHVDVTEIDAASNTGVEDVRALRETIGFAPMEGRYKIFIVDEAHMLSKSAFNALLKTLEEPPPKAVFIFATTEAHKFPATIISRCQHFVFRHLPEEEIFGHLSGILKLENMPYDESAVHLLARRAQGSVRDSLSLLDQTLAVSEGKLDLATVREALGLAGQDFFADLLTALSQCSFAKIMELSRHLLGSGVDIGFFTRELAGNLRNLFLLCQAGESILSSLDVSGDEAAFLKKLAPLFSASHLHAAWQMTLEAQRGIALSPEPGAALELLLLNLAMLPRLLPIASLPTPPPAENQASAQNPPALSHDEAPKARGRDVQAPKSEPQSQAPEQEPISPQANGWQSHASPGTGGELRESPAAGFAAGAKKEPEPAPDWQGFREFCEKSEAHIPKDVLSVGAQWSNGRLVLRPQVAKLHDRLKNHEKALREALEQYCKGNIPEIEIIEPAPAVSRQEMLDACANAPEIREIQNILGGKIIDCKKRST